MNKTAPQTEGRELYLVLSQTGTFLSHILKLFTKSKYNHSSLSLTKDLSTMYSFGRLHPYNAFWGGYVKEGLNEGVYKRFPNTVAAIFIIKVSEENYTAINSRLEEMYTERKKYHYNTFGLFTAIFGIHFKRKNDYYCSDFVSEILTDFGIINKSDLNEIVKPSDFYYIFNNSLIYEGVFKDFDPNGNTDSIPAVELIEQS